MPELNKVDQLVRRLLLAHPTSCQNRFDVMAWLLTPPIEVQPYPRAWDANGELVVEPVSADNPDTPEAMVQHFAKMATYEWKESEEWEPDSAMGKLSNRQFCTAAKDLHDARFRAAHIDLLATTYATVDIAVIRAWAYDVDRRGGRPYWPINYLPANLSKEWHDAIAEWMEEAWMVVGGLFGEYNAADELVAIPRYATTFNWLKAKLAELSPEFVT